MISIIVLHHNKAEYSRACLHSLLQSTASPLEVINVDNGSYDETPQVLDAW
jgi:GT2 family glycosyltransferase